MEQLKEERKIVGLQITKTPLYAVFVNGVFEITEVLEVEYLAVCMDGSVQPLVILDGNIELCEDCDGYDGVYTWLGLKKLNDAKVFRILEKQC